MRVALSLFIAAWMLGILALPNDFAWSIETPSNPLEYIEQVLPGNGKKLKQLQDRSGMNHSPIRSERALKRLQKPYRKNRSLQRFQHNLFTPASERNNGLFHRIKKHFSNSSRQEIRIQQSPDTIDSILNQLDPTVPKS